MRKLKKKKKRNTQTKEPDLQDQHLVLLFPIKFEQFVHVHFQQKHKEELFHPFDLKLIEKLSKKKMKKTFF